MEQLAIAIFGNSYEKILYTISELTIKYECHILRAHMTSLGSIYAFTALITGNWNTIAKIEAALQNEEANAAGSIIFERTKSKNHQENFLPYSIHVTGIDDTNIACEIWSFFTAQGIDIDNLSLATGITGARTPLFDLKISMNVPADISLASLREQFLSLCNELNVDGSIELKTIAT